MNSKNNSDQLDSIVDKIKQSQRTTNEEKNIIFEQILKDVKYFSLKQLEVLDDFFISDDTGQIKKNLRREIEVKRHTRTMTANYLILALTGATLAVTTLTLFLP